MRIARAKVVLRAASEKKADVLREEDELANLIDHTPKEMAAVLYKKGRVFENIHFKRLKIKKVAAECRELKHSIKNFGKVVTASTPKDTTSSKRTLPANLSLRFGRRMKRHKFDVEELEEIDYRISYHVSVGSMFSGSDNDDDDDEKVDVHSDNDCNKSIFNNNYTTTTTDSTGNVHDNDNAGGTSNHDGGGDGRGNDNDNDNDKEDCNGDIGNDDEDDANNDQHDLDSGNFMNRKRDFGRVIKIRTTTPHSDEGHYKCDTNQYSSKYCSIDAHQEHKKPSRVSKRRRHNFSSDNYHNIDENGSNHCNGERGEHVLPRGSLFPRESWRRRLISSMD